MRSVAHVLREFNAIHAGHVVIGKNGVKALTGLQQLQCGLRRICGGATHAPAREQGIENGAAGGVVVNHQYVLIIDIDICGR